MAGMMLDILKNTAKNVLRNMGYSLSRINHNDLNFPQIDVFTLIANNLHTHCNGEIFLLQIGANDGIRSDPVHSLITKLQWNGMLVEPQPEVFERLVKNYAGNSRVDFANTLISSEASLEARLFVPRSKLDEERLRLTGLASLDQKSLIRSMQQLGYNQADFTIESIRVPCTTITNLLESKSIKKIDVLVIDTEGHDFKILKGLDFNIYRPKLILMEFFHLSYAEQTECVAMLSERGYVMIRVLGDLVASNCVKKA